MIIVGAKKYDFTNEKGSRYTGYTCYALRSPYSTEEAFGSVVEKFSVSTEMFEKFNIRKLISDKVSVDVLFNRFGKPVDFRPL